MPDSTEPILWQGRPSGLVDLPFYVLLLLGAILGTLGLLFLLPAVSVGPEADRTARVFSWVLSGLWVLCVALALWRYVSRRAVRYRVTTERLRITTGILSLVTEDIELRRVRDTSVARTFFQRMVGLGDVRIVSADSRTPRVTLHAVPRPDELQETLRRLTEELIVRHAVREVDIR
jgi:uncharacterized membrane protein YdbT with pleckstrin-like domain